MFPINDMELQASEYAKRMRPVFIASLILLMILVVGKFVILDYVGAISLFFVVLTGMFVLSGSEGINGTYALFYAVIAIISGIFDVISCMLYFQHSKYKLFDEKAETIALVAQVIFIASPIALFISASISYSIFSSCRDQTEESLDRLREIEYAQYGAAPPGGFRSEPRRQPQMGAGPGNPRANRDQHGFSAFQGQGNRLGS